MDASSRPPHSDSYPSARCSRCGAAFDCGAAARPFECWCAGMPALREQGRAAGALSSRCLCPACYADALAASGGRRTAADGTGAAHVISPPKP